MNHPIKFIPNDRRIVVELLPEDAPKKSSVIVGSEGTLLTEVKNVNRTEVYTVIPMTTVIQRPENAAMIYRKAVVIAVNKGYNQGGVSFPCPFELGDVVLLNIRNFETHLYTEENCEPGKEREVFIIAEHHIIGKLDLSKES